MSKLLFKVAKIARFNLEGKGVISKDMILENIIKMQAVSVHGKLRFGR